MKDDTAQIPNDIPAPALPALPPPVDFAVLGETLRRLEDATAHITLSQEGVVTAWNAQAEAVLGYTAVEAIGQPLAGLVIPPSLQGAHQAGLARWQATAIAPVVCKRLQTTARHKDGSVVPVAVTVQVVRDNGHVRFLGWIEVRGGDDVQP